MEAPKPVGSPEWVEWFIKQPRKPPTPRSIYVDKFEEEFESKTTFQLWELFVEDTEKNHCDRSRILHIIHDCFEDETTFQECAQMVIDFCKFQKLFPKE